MEAASIWLHAHLRVVQKEKQHKNFALNFFFYISTIFVCVFVIDLSGTKTQTKILVVFLKTQTI